MKFPKLVILLSLPFVFSCEKTQTVKQKFIDLDITREDLTNVRIYLSERGDTKGLLTSPYMRRFTAPDSKYTEFPNRVRMDLYDDSSVVETVIDSKYGRYYEKENKVLLRESVVVINMVKHDTLKTSELWWDQETARFYTDKSVEIREPDKTIYGTGLKADQNLNWYDITDITGTVLTSSSLND